MAKILVQVTCGPNDPTRAALAFIVARAALEEGHEVSVFLVGDAVQLFREATLDALVGLGTGRLREHYDALAAGGARFYLSRFSSEARGFSDADLEGKPARFAFPKDLVQLTLAHERVLTY
jgi:predicted peroxiredoxin